jgi:hypothetical protein
LGSDFRCARHVLFITEGNVCNLIWKYNFIIILGQEGVHGRGRELEAAKGEGPGGKVTPFTNSVRAV